MASASMAMAFLGKARVRPGPLGLTITVLDLADKDKRLLPTEEPERESELLGGDPEFEFIKGRYREDFHAAFRAALDKLSREERTCCGRTSSTV